MSNDPQAPSTPSPAPDTLPAPVSSPEPAPTSLPSHVGLPADPGAYKLTTWVKGGTTSSAFDKELAQKCADATERREQEAKDLKLSSIPVEQGGAMTFTHKMADPLESPRVLIKYVGRTREVKMEMLCELVIDDVSENQSHMLIFVCPECHNRGIPSQFCQLHARNDHRAWHLDTRGAGKIEGVRNSDAPNGVEAYTNAGKIVDTDVLRCVHQNCGAAYKIHNNIMYRVD